MDIRKQRVIIEWSDDNGWMAMFDDGAVEFFETPVQAFKAVQRRSAKGNTDATITTIEWRNTPAGFEPPKG